MRYIIEPQKKYIYKIQIPWFYCNRVFVSYTYLIRGFIIVKIKITLLVNYKMHHIESII